MRDAIDRNTELIQNENTRIDSLESKTSDLEKTIGNVVALSAALGLFLPLALTLNSLVVLAEGRTAAHTH